MRPTLPGVRITGLPPAGTLTGAEAIEIDMPITLANGQPSSRTFKTTLNDLLRLYGNRRDNPNQVSAGQTGAYTIQQVEDLLRNKLGVGDTVINSMKLDGVSREELIAEARNGLVADSMRLGGQLPAHYTADSDFTMLVDQLTESFITASEI